MMTLKKISEAKMPCMSPSHEVPAHMALTPGTYEWTCIACGEKTTFEIPLIMA